MNGTRRYRKAQLVAVTAYVLRSKKKPTTIHIDGFAARLKQLADDYYAETYDTPPIVTKTMERMNSLLAGTRNPTIELLQLDFGGTIPWNELCSLARERIITPGRLKEVCRYCEWIEICSSMEKRRQTQ